LYPRGIAIFLHIAAVLKRNGCKPPERVKIPLQHVPPPRNKEIKCTQFFSTTEKGDKLLKLEKFLYSCFGGHNQ